MLPVSPSTMSSLSATLTRSSGSQYHARNGPHGRSSGNLLRGLPDNRAEPAITNSYTRTGRGRAGANRKRAHDESEHDEGFGSAMPPDSELVTKKRHTATVKTVQGV